MESRSTVLLEKLENLIATKSVVGETINVDGVLIIPFIDVSFGVGIGSSSGESTEKGKGGADGGGAGAKMSPSAVLVVNGDTVQLVNIKNQDSLNKLIDMVPNVLNKFNLNLGSKDEGCRCGDECGCQNEEKEVQEIE